MGAKNGRVGGRGWAPRRAATLSLLIVCALLAMGASSSGVRTGDLTPREETLVREIEEKLIAPCCFRQTLAEHRSALADTLRNEVRRMVATGATGEQVVDHFLGKYGERILATPRVQGFNLLAYVMPAFLLAGGLMLLLRFFRGAANQAGAGPIPERGSDSFATDSHEQLKARVKEELERFPA